jgi:hypothetical protein
MTQVIGLVYNISCILAEPRTAETIFAYPFLLPKCKVRYD